jgi:CubicO group peptidase (beta-lactamase class C family)
MCCRGGAVEYEICWPGCLVQGVTSKERKLAMTQARVATRISPEGLDQIKAEFDRQLRAGLHPAAALAVYAGGKLAVDLVGGIADAASGRTAGPDSLFRVFSCGKPLAAACLWVLKERGKVAWDDPVAKHWPEFGSKGKERVTVRHVLTHQAGLPTTPKELAGPAAVADWNRCVAAMENAELEFAPGSRTQYHPATFGWLVAELVNRISGRPFLEFFQDHVAGPLGLRNTHFALPPSLNGRAVKLKAMPGFENVEAAVRWNDERGYPVPVPGGSCMSQARELARFYAALTGGGRIDGVPWLRPETVAEVTALAAEGVDPVGGGYHRRTLGFAMPAYEPHPTGAGPRSGTFAHGGMATCINWGDPGLGVACAYLTSGMQPEALDRERLHRMSMAVRAAVAA